MRTCVSVRIIICLQCVMRVRVRVRVRVHACECVCVHVHVIVCPHAWCANSTLIITLLFALLLGTSFSDWESSLEYLEEVLTKNTTLCSLKLPVSLIPTLARE